jgi:intracellular sulfur oxidation DsrE/DsrF family protein
MKINRSLSSATIAVLFLVHGLSIVQQSDLSLATPAPAQRRAIAPKQESNQERKEVLPKVVFLNQSAVLIASRKNKDKYREHQAELIDLMNKGVTVLICPDCMKQYGINTADLIDGVQIGKPSQTHES